MEQKDYYKVLGVNEDASFEEIKHRFSQKPKRHYLIGHSSDKNQ